MHFSRGCLLTACLAFWGAGEESLAFFPIEFRFAFFFFFNGSEMLFPAAAVI